MDRTDFLIVLGRYVHKNDDRLVIMRAFDDAMAALRAPNPAPSAAVCGVCGGTRVVYPNAPDNYNQTLCPACGEGAR